MSQDTAQTAPAATIRKYFYRLIQPGLSKHAQLRQSVIQAVEDGELVPDEKLPPERELGVILGISLGTTQKALGGLATDGYIIRKQGIGTFIRQPKSSIQKTWHYRFTDLQTGHHLPVYAHLLRRSTVSTFTQAHRLGPSPGGYIRIDRSISVDDRFHCYSELYLPSARFQPLLEIDREMLENINLKELLETECGYPTTEAKGGARLVQLSERIAKSMHVETNSWALRIDILGSMGEQPISYQKMFVPPADCNLDMDFIGPR